MSQTAIQVEGLGKKYRLGGPQQRYSTLGDQVRKWTSLRTLLRRAARSESRPTFWALKDVSFEVEQGEVVGVIGRNGAGKSTLLKVLSRITEPTEGAVDIHGRVGSLLEVGTGFHPELTGRENIYLNGAILGMRRAETTRKFDEIVAFAEVEKFIDTQVKHYSSGMYTRLAFAVAAHMEPEILIIDEVLAVGDAQFQKKCLGKMGEVAKQGRTVLFVSHNMAAVETLCRRCVFLDEGRVRSVGPTTGVLREYSTMTGGATAIVHQRSKRLEFEGVANQGELHSLAPAEDVTIRVGFKCESVDLGKLYVDLALTNERDERVVHARASQVCNPFPVKADTRFFVEYCFESPRLAPGVYTLTVYAKSELGLEFWAEKIPCLTIKSESDFGQALTFDGLTAAVVPKFTIRVAECEGVASS